MTCGTAFLLPYIVNKIDTVSAITPIINAVSKLRQDFFIFSSVILYIFHNTQLNKVLALLYLFNLKFIVNLISPIITK